MIRNLTSTKMTLVNNIQLMVKYNINSSKLSQPKRDNEIQIASLLRNNLKATYVKIIDTTVTNSQCGTMLKMTIESPLFQNKSKVEQHQMVTEALKEKMDTIHGFNLKTIVSNNQQMEKRE